MAAVDRAAATVIEDAGRGDHFTHGLGHGVGLEIHEDPYLGAARQVNSPPHTALTVEPGIYLPGRGGVRIEDTARGRPTGTGAAHHYHQDFSSWVSLREPRDGHTDGTTNDLKNGMVLNLDGQLWSVVWFQHHKPGKGGAVVRTKLKNVLSGKIVDKTFNADVKVETANVDKRDDDRTSTTTARAYVFMDTETYEQLHVPAETVGDAVALHAREPGGDRRRRTTGCRSTSSCRPRSSCRRVHRARPAGRPSTGGTKPARLETGLRDPGPAVHHHRREGQGRHPRRQLPRPRDELMGARTKARKRALDILFESELRGLPVAARSRAPAGGRDRRSTTTR